MSLSLTRNIFALLDAETVDVSVEKYGDINVVAGALKSFFRSLPEPLIPYELYDEFISAIGK
jgi:hypothetical protein